MATTYTVTSLAELYNHVQRHFEEEAPSEISVVGDNGEAATYPAEE